jgi:hypothetical protein
MRKLGSLLLIAVFSCAAALADDPDPVALVRKSIDRIKAEGAKAQQYTYREYRVQHEFDSHGKETETNTQTWDVIGLEGSTYRKLVMRNDKPLEAKEQKREDERLRKETERRRKETPEERHKRVFSFSYSLSFPYDKTIDLYDLRYVGEEASGSNGAYVVAGTPKTGVTPKTADERESLNYAVKVWLVKSSYAIARLDLEVVGDHSRMQKGSHVRIDYSQHDDGVWLPDLLTFQFNARFFKMMNVRGEVTVTYSDYHKFQVDSRIVDVETPH